MSIPPSPNRSDPPEFHRLDEDAFERLTLSLYQNEPDIKLADLYGADFDSQYGIDVIANRHDGGIEVSSCKCYSSIRKGQMEKWSSDFLDHWETHWKDKHVRKFVLTVASFVHSEERIADITAERERFRAIGVEYDVWGRYQLQEKLRPHPGIVSQFLGVYYEDQICGSVRAGINLESPSAVNITQIAAAQIVALQKELSNQVERRLDGAVAALRRGDLESVERQITELRAGTHWDQIPPPTQARIVRLQGSLSLQHGDVNSAQARCEEADAIAPVDERRLHALITARREDPARGLAELGVPTTVDGLHLQCALLMESGDTAGALRILDNHPLLLPLHPETLRLRALALLLNNERTSAQAAIDKAEEIEPQWPAIKRAGAMVRYARALSPRATQTWTVAMNPVDFDLVRMDDIGRALLLEALARFDALATADADPMLRMHDRVSALACVCNLRDRHAEAEERCRRLLAEAPTNTLAIMWALARGLNIDQGASASAIEEILHRGQADAQHVLTLAWLRVSDERTTDAIRLMRDHAALFDTPTAQAVHQQWLADFDVTQLGEVSDTSSRSQSDEMRLLSMIEQATTTGDWSAVDGLFHSLVAVPDPSPFTLRAARALAAASRWEVLARYADTLLAFETAEAVRLAAHATSRVGDAARALAIIQHNAAAFPGGALPHDLRVLEINALHASGDPAAAVRAAKALAAETGSLDDMLVQAQAHLRTGNVREALPYIKRAIAEKAIDSREALQLVPLVGTESQELARDLLRHATRQGLPPDLATAAFLHAAHLGIEHEMRELFGGIRSLAEQNTGTVRLLSFEEVVDLLRRSREQNLDLQEKYFNGIAPVHIFAQMSRANLAKMYCLPTDVRTVHYNGPFMIRHGARPLDSSGLPPISQWTIYIDVTGLLLASQLGLLDELEGLPQPIFVSPTLQELLIELEHQARPHQPNRIDGLRHLLHLLAEGRVSATVIPTSTSIGEDIVDNHDQRAMAAASMMAGDQLLVTHHQPRNSGEHAERFTTLRLIVDGLLRAGAIDAHGLSDALEKLGNYAPDQNGTCPASGSKLAFLDNTIEVLTSAGLLQPLVQVYRVTVDSSFVEHARENVAQADHDNAIGDWIKDLRNRVATGIESGRYRYMVVNDSEARAAPTRDGEDHDDLQADRVTRCLTDLIQSTVSAGAVVWVDDRHVSGYPQHHAAPFIGVTDVLGALRRAGLMPDEAYFDALLRLRAGGAMFIPVDSEEVLFHLNAAPIHNGVVVETPALAVLRRYIARSMLMDRHLKIHGKPEGLDNRPEEYPFLATLRRLAEDCIIGTWAHPQASETECRARASWIWTELRVDWFLLDRDDLPTSRHARLILLPSLQCCALLTRALSIMGTTIRHTRSRRRGYFSWVNDYVLANRFEADSEFATKVIESLRDMLLEQLRREDNEPRPVQQLMARMFALLVDQFPGPIRQRLLKSHELCARLGINFTETVRVAGMFFEARRFWKAITRTRAYGRAHVRPTKGRPRVILRRVSKNGEQTVRANIADRVVLDDPAFGLLDRSMDERIRILTKHIDWFDIPAEERATAIHNIAAVMDSVARLETLNTFRQQSAQLHYEKMFASLRRRINHRFVTLRPPTAAALRKHLRLLPDTTTSFSVRLAAAADTLISDYGPVTAFRRMGTLPVATPNSIIQAIGRLDDDTRRTAVETICAHAKSPLQLLHALRLCRVLIDAHRYTSVQQDVLNRLLANCELTARLFSEVIKWTESAFGQDDSWSAMPATDRLALVWAHADKLTETLLTIGFDPSQVAKDVSANHMHRPLRSALHLDKDYEIAAAAVDTITPQGLLFHGMAYALTGATVSTVLSTEQHAKLREFLTITGADGTMPSLHILVNREDANNDLGSFLVLRSNELLPAEIADTTGVSILNELLVALEADPNNSDHWITLWGFSRPTVSVQFRPRVAAILSMVNFVNVVERSPNDMFVIRMIMDCWLRYGTDETRNEMLEKLCTAMRFIGATTQQNGNLAPSFEEKMRHILEAAFMWSRSEDVKIAYSNISKALIALTTVCEEANNRIRDVIAGIIIQERLEFGILLWRAMLALRIR